MLYEVAITSKPEADKPEELKWGPETLVAKDADQAKWIALVESKLDPRTAITVHCRSFS
jgi:hypothetical protein